MTHDEELRYKYRADYHKWNKRNKRSSMCL